MKTKRMKVFIKVAMVLWFLQIKCLAFTQISSGKTDSYIIAFNPVYASGLLDIGYVSFEELYLIVSDKPLKIDSVMSALSRRNYSTKQGILDTLSNEFKVYRLVENDSKTKKEKRINKMLNDYCQYGRRFLFSLNEIVKKSSSLVGFVVSRHFSLDNKVTYKVLNENCGDFPNECRAMITSL